MGIELRFYSNQEGDNVNMGNVIPPWNGNYNKSNWWLNNNDNTNFFYSATTNETFVQYGQNFSNPNVTWASARFFGEKVEKLEETENSDGSTTVKVRVTPTFFSGRQTDYSSGIGYRVIYSVKINNVEVYNFNGTTVEEFTFGQATPQTFTINVPPSKQVTATALEVNISYPNGEYNNNKIIVGIVAYNTNPPTYIPNQVVENGIVCSLNDYHGKNLVVKNGILYDISYENIETKGTENGNNRVVVNGKATQADSY